MSQSPWQDLMSHSNAKHRFTTLFLSGDIQNLEEEKKSQLCIRQRFEHFKNILTGTVQLRDSIPLAAQHREILIFLCIQNQHVSKYVWLEETRDYHSSFHRYLHLSMGQKKTKTADCLNLCHSKSQRGKYIFRWSFGKTINYRFH